MSNVQNIQWFPGHMAKTRRMMKEMLPQTDLIIELLDARIPARSKNPELNRLAGNKPVLTLLAKSSLADPAASERWKKHFADEGRTCLFVDSTTGYGINSIAPAVREVMVSLQRKVGETGDVVAEGRDIGTVVFPAADVKVFLTASPEARARRRAVQRSGGNLAQDAAATADPEEERRILADLKRRDDYDSSRATSPLRPADDAVIIDSSEMGCEDVVEKIASLSPALLARANA